MCCKHFGVGLHLALTEETSSVVYKKGKKIVYMWKHYKNITTWRPTQHSCGHVQTSNSEQPYKRQYMLQGDLRSHTIACISSGCDHLITHLTLNFALQQQLKKVVRPWLPDRPHRFLCLCNIYTLAVANYSGIKVMFLYTSVNILVAHQLVSLAQFLKTS